MSPNPVSLVKLMYADRYPQVMPSEGCAQCMSSHADCFPPLVDYYVDADTLHPPCYRCCQLRLLCVPIAGAFEPFAIGVLYSTTYQGDPSVVMNIPSSP